jgi:hypothetical protein
MKMGAKISVLGLSLSIILGLSASHSLAGSPVSYLGKTTWTITITDSTKQSDIGMSITVTGGISKVGDEFYLFQGYLIPPDDGPFVMTGSGFMTGNTLELTLRESQYHTSNTWRDGGVMHVSIDKTTLNGTVYDVGHDFNTDPADRRFDARYSAGTLTRSGPAISF